MRYRQVGAAAGVVAVVVTGVPGSSPSSTLALLSDQAVVAGSAQAAVLSLEVRVDAADGQPLSPPALDGGDTGHVEVTVTGELDWQLTLQLLPEDGEAGCGGGAEGVVDVVSDSGSWSLAECAAAQVVGSGQGTGAGRSRALTVHGDRGEDVVGLLRFRVVQVPGGFSDVVDVAVRAADDEAVTDEEGPPAVDDPDARAGEESAGGGESSAPAAPPAGGSTTGPGESSGGGAAPGTATPPAPPADEPTTVEQSPGGGTPPPVDSGDTTEEDPPGVPEPSAAEETVPDPAG